jgi:hypothetical protein
MLTAEVRQDKGWHQVDTGAAKILRDNPMRCERCHGAVYLMQDYTQERRTKFTHRRQFLACGISSGGIPMRHPRGARLAAAVLWRNLPTAEIWHEAAECASTTVAPGRCMPR